MSTIGDLIGHIVVRPGHLAGRVVEEEHLDQPGSPLPLHWLILSKQHGVNVAVGAEDVRTMPPRRTP